MIFLQIKKQGQWKEEWIYFSQSLHPESIWWIGVVVVIAPFNWLTESVKWQLLLKKIETISLKKAFSAVLSGIFVAFVTPNKTGDFLGRILFLKRKSRLRGAIASLISSLAQIVITSFFGLIGLCLLEMIQPAFWVGILLLLSLSVLAFLLYLYLHIERVSRWSSKFRKLKPLVIALYVLKRYSRKELWEVLSLAALRFCIYNSQFLLLLFAFESGIPVVSGFFLSGLMFWLITIIPTFFVADIGVRGFVTGLVFIATGITKSPFSVLAASYLLWLINWVLPAIFGSFGAVRKGIQQRLS